MGRSLFELAQPAKAIILMPPRNANVALRLILAGILGATSLCGSNLHELFGIEHAGFARRAISQGADLHSARSAAISAGREQAVHDYRCAVCNYLSQVQLPSPSFAGAPASASAPMPRLIFSAAFPAACFSPFHSRAPPVA
jgi:hypothetical protein